MTEKKKYLIRPARLDDAMAIFDLIQSYHDDLIPRPMGEIISNIDRFIVCESEGVVAGCAAWKIIPEIGNPSKASVEVQSVAVNEEFRRRGIGSKLVRNIIENVRRFDPFQAIVLTFAPQFFSALGFVEVPKTSVMHKLYMGCINCTKHANPFTCPEIAMVYDLRARH
ncbi:MAG: GNAT family N-acetyltransferase [Kiritimatiellia bacterium]